MAGYAAIVNGKTHEFALESRRFAGCNGFATDKFTFVELGDPAEACLEGGGCIINVVAIQAVAHLQAEGVAGTQSRRQEAFFLTSLEYHRP